jgi:CRISPR system Cascade subunit CasB
MDYYRLGLVAGVLATVEEDLDRSMPDGGDAGRSEIRTLGRRLGHVEGGAPRMSELRFRRMLAAAEPEDLLRQWRRAVHLVRRKAHVASLADDLYAWLKELDNPEAYADRSVRFHWAYDYYQQPRGMEPDGDPSPALEAAE